MTEGVTISTRVCAGGPIRLLVVANATRGHLAARIRFTRRRVAGVAIVVCREVSGDRQPGATIDRRAMTTCATSLWSRYAGVVLSVIKLHVERFVKAGWKVFQRRIAAADVCVTDRAHRGSRRGELAAMTVRASLMTGKPWSCGVVGPFMTRVTGEGTMALGVVTEFRVVLSRENGENTNDADFEPRIDHLMSFRLSGTRSAIR